VHAYFSQNHASKYGCFIMKQPNGEFIFVTDTSAVGHFVCKEKDIYNAYFTNSLFEDLTYVGDVISEPYVYTDDLKTCPNEQFTKGKK
jgi:hypothetical protein